jgi:transposase
VIVTPFGVRVLAATQPVDFRKGIDGLAALVQEHLRLDPYAGTIYVFRAKRADRVKLLIWDGSGLVVVYTRLEDGRFRWPSVEDGVLRLLPALIEGLDCCRVHARRVARPTATQ